MPEDQRDVYVEMRKAMEEILSREGLSDEQKRDLRIAMDFGYAAAYSSRTYDMRGSMFGGNEFDSGIKEMRGNLPK